MSDEHVTKTESNPPPGTTKAFVMKAKSLATLIAAVTALIVGIGNACKKPEEPGAKAAYAELASATKQNSEQIGEMHDDIVALRGYVDGIVKAEGIVVPKDAGLVAVPPSSAAARPSSSSAAAPTSTASAVVAIVPIDRSKMQPPPPVSPKPSVFEPQGFDKLQNAKK